MKIKILRLYALIFLSVFLFTACSDDEPTPEVLPGQEGFFIVNEGAWGNGNTSLSYFDKESKTMTNDVFYTFNDEKSLGDQAQSMTIFNERGYIVVQNSAKIEVIGTTDYNNSATIDTDISSPRFFIGVSETKGYVSDWGADGVTGTIKVIDLETNKVIKTITEVGQGSNRMVMVGINVYVANAGGWGNDNTIAIIDTSTDTKTGAITVGDNPSALVADANGNIWVAGKGKTAYNNDFSVDLENSTTGYISKIGTDNKVIFTLEMAEKTGSPSNLVLNTAQTTLYFNYTDGIYSYDATSTTSTQITKVIEKEFYGFSMDPSTDNLIICESPSFSESGTMYRYESNGTLIDSYTVGIGPNGMAY